MKNPSFGMIITIKLEYVMDFHVKNKINSKMYKGPILMMGHNLRLEKKSHGHNDLDSM